RTALAGQHQSGIRPFARTRDSGPHTKSGHSARSGGFRRKPESEKRLRSAMEPVSPENLWSELEYRDRLSRLQANESWGARRKPEPAHGGTTCTRSHLDAIGSESVLWTDPGVVLAGWANHSSRSTSSTLSTVHNGRSLSQ